MNDIEEITEPDVRADVEPEVGPEDERDRPGPRRWPTVAAMLALLVGLTLAVGWGWVQRDDAAAASARIDRQRDAVLVATGFVEALMSYDHEDLDAQQSAVEGFVTEQFRTDLADAFTTDVRDQIVAAKATSTVTVEDVYVTTDEGDEVGVIVHARSEVSSEGGATAELESYLSVRLVRLGGHWKADELTSLGTRDLSSPLAPPTTAAEGSGG